MFFACWFICIWCLHYIPKELGHGAGLLLRSITFSLTTYSKSLWNRGHCTAEVLKVKFLPIFSWYLTSVAEQSGVSVDVFCTSECTTHRSELRKTVAFPQIFFTKSRCCNTCRMCLGVVLLKYTGLYPERRYLDGNTCCCKSIVSIIVAFTDVEVADAYTITNADF